MLGGCPAVGVRERPQTRSRVVLRGEQVILEAVDVEQNDAEFGRTRSKRILFGDELNLFYAVDSVEMTTVISLGPCSAHRTEHSLAGHGWPWRPCGTPGAVPPPHRNRVLTIN